jgi:hypothetical protein
MTIKVVGAGLGRTGTYSLKLALEKLLGGPCYHMREVFTHPEHIPLWHQAFKGRMPDWPKMLDGFSAVVDEPASCFWHELSLAFPEALVILSVRDPESWWKSADSTILNDSRHEAPKGPPSISTWHAMVTEMNRFVFPKGSNEKNAAMEAFESHNRKVRETIPALRLLEWQATEGWGPICKALGLPVPDEPFPHENTTKEWLELRKQIK